MKKTKKPITKAGYIGTLAFEIGLFVLAFVVLTIFFNRDQKALGITALFAIILIDLIIMFLKLDRLLEYDAQKKAEEIDKISHISISNASYEKLRSACSKARFKSLEQGYLHKFRLSFSNSRNFINYFVRFSDYTDLSGTVHREFQRFDFINFKQFNKCLLLFLFSDKVTDDDLAVSKSLIKPFIVAEHITMSSCFDSKIIILVDRSTQKAYFVPNNKFRFKTSIYGHGMKMVQKLLKQQLNQSVS